MITFKKLRFKNFLSTGNVFTEIDFEAARTILVVGKNGGGKSTMIDALHYALYGKPFRDINKPQLVNTINRKDMMVELEFVVSGIQYLIRRGMKPNVFEVFQGDHMINQNAESKEYQDVLEKNVIKMSSRTFCQIVILGSRSYIPFMRLPTGARREIIEDLLDIQMFSLMNSFLKDNISSNKIQIQTNSSDMKALAGQIEILQRHLESLKRNRNDLILQKEQQLVDFKEKVTVHKASLAKMSEDVESMLHSISDSSQVAERDKQYRQALTKIQTRVERLSKEIKFYTESDNCPTCKQGIPHEHKQTAIETDSNIIAECEEGLQQLNDKLQQIARRQEEIRNITQNIHQIQRDEQAVKAKIQMLESSIVSVQKEIDDMSTNSTDTNDISKELKEKKTELKKKVQLAEELAEQRQLYEVASVILKDTGIKTKIIRQYIPVINKLINKYLASMDFFVNFELNESFEEVIKSRHRDEFSYASFSEGEKQRLDIAILLTWRAIAKLRNSASTNLLILDEVFDSSLDTSGNEELLTILTELAAETNVYIISHRGDTMMDRFERVIRFEKNKNFSEMIVL